MTRDRSGEFEPQFIRKGEKRFGGFDTKIIAMYAQGMTVREIKRFLERQYKVEVSTDLISTVTNSVLEDVIEWQYRPLEPMYPVVFFDAFRVKIATKERSKTKRCTWCWTSKGMGSRMCWGSGSSRVREPSSGSGSCTSSDHRGLNDILVAVIDGLKGFPEAINALYPDCEIQTCIVHLIRHSLSFCNWKERKPVATELKKIYSAETAELALKRLEDFEQGALGKKDPRNRSMLAQSLGTSGALFRLSQRNPKDHLHDQRDRKFAHAITQGAQNKVSFSERLRKSHQAIYLCGHHQKSGDF